MCSPLASSAEASVSPGWPASVAPPKVKRSVRARSMQPALRQAVGLLAHAAAAALARRHHLRRIVAGADRRFAARRRRQVGLHLGARLADLVDGEDLVGRGVAQHVEPAAAAGLVVPALGEDALRVGAQEDVAGPFRRRSSLSAASSGARCAPRRHRRIRRCRARRNPGTADQEHETADPQCATAAAPCSATSAPVEKRSSVNGAAMRVRLVARDEVGEGVAGAGRRLPAAGPPAAVDVKALHRRLRDDRARVRADVDDAAPLPHHPQPRDERETARSATPSGAR